MGAIAAVVAFEAQVVQVGISVSNALTVPTGNDLQFGASFPEEWLRDEITVQLSGTFLAASGVNSATVEVWIECGDPAVYWMGDFAYLATTDPFTTLPGLGTGGVAGDSGLPPNQGSKTQLPNAPWEYVGGDPKGCGPGATASPNKAGVFTVGDGNAVVLDKSGSSSVGLFLGLDIPVCDFNFNTSTDPDPKPSGYNEPTIVLKSGDPRYQDKTTDPECAYDAGMNVVFQVVNIARVGAVGNIGPIVTLTGPTSGLEDSSPLI